MEDYKSIKVLYITQYSGFMGANRSLLQIAKFLRDSYGVNPIVVLPALGEFSDLLQKEHIHFRVIRNYYTLYVGNNRLNNVLYVLKGIIGEFLNIVIAFYYSLFVFRKEKIALVHTNTSATNMGAYLAFFLRVKHIWHIREFLVLHYGLRFPWGHKLQRFIMRNFSDRVIPISFAVKRYISGFIPESKIKLVYNGFSTFSLPPRKKQKNEKINIALVGLIHPSKNQIIVVKAINGLIEKGVCNLHLSIIGDYDPLYSNYYEEIKEFVLLHKLESFITFNGYVSDVPSLLTSMHIGILASENEAFGRVTVEYMLNGLLPIAFNSGGSVEIITNGINGFLFDDVEQLEHILYSAIMDVDKLKQMSRVAYQSAVDRFSISNTVRELYGCYMDVLN